MSLFLGLEKSRKMQIIRKIANIIRKLKNGYSSWRITVSSGSKRISYILMLDKLIPEEKIKGKPVVLTKKENIQFYSDPENPKKLKTA
jgi:hypothetical protein